MINTIIFDLGAVLIDWNPHYLYQTIFEDEAERHTFLNTVCTPAWNEEQDGGRSLQEATDLLLTQFPEHETAIRAFYGRWTEMLGGPIQGTVDIFSELKATGQLKFYALTNWSSETFPIAQAQYEFLNWFDGIVVSGEEKDRKPFASFYNTLLTRYGVEPAEALFIDDNLRNVKAAEALGIHSVHFTSPDALRTELIQHGLLPAAV
ncbi:HAD family hydrolase [Fibrivirga algicola]|uniref:HAD family phosphatase n=1 Tax=Fibrivirga algicola TaxID=2950420 RepID=A0ABX0QSU1_9BACT|nr:HAD family phosphatase [Fibrivirga algicola]ARK11869.1 HAD family hydrolase [Fibrella sp. ES10-3-2-2]NID13229.1 HAD family phosphatase [Fibrivirga algicola]